MDKNIKIDTQSLNNIITKLEQKKTNIDELYKSLNSKMELLNGESKVWKGKVQDLIYNHYLKLSQNFSSNIEELNSHINFLKKTIEKYENEDKSLIKDMENNENNLTIN